MNETLKTLLEGVVIVLVVLAGIGAGIGWIIQRTAPRDEDLWKIGREK